LAAVERILLLFPGVVELRSRHLYQLGHWAAAGNDFETYLAKAANAEDAPVIRRLLNQLGETLNKLLPVFVSLSATRLRRRQLGLHVFFCPG